MPAVIRFRKWKTTWNSELAFRKERFSLCDISECWLQKMLFWRV